jgi:hypothetical protein
MIENCQLHSFLKTELSIRYSSDPWKDNIEVSLSSLILESQGVTVSSVSRDYLMEQHLHFKAEARLNVI